MADTTGAPEIERVIRDQALEVGRGWSGPDAEPGGALVSALFDVDLGVAGSFGPPDSPVRLRCAVRGRPPLPPAAPDIVARVGIDAAPIDPTPTTWREYRRLVCAMRDRRFHGCDVVSVDSAHGCLVRPNVDLS